ncbi:MAG: hypothetical protein ABSH13_19910, partial [Candidatus Acidiferrum sp.]
MQHEQGLPLTRLQNAFIKVRILPGRKLLWLILRKAGLHGKLSFGKIERFLYFEWLGHGSMESIPFCTVIRLKCVPWGNIGRQGNHVC